MGKRTAGNGHCEELLRGNSVVTHPRDGLEEGVQSTLSSHSWKFGDCKYQRGQKEQRGWGGQ